MGGLDDAIDAVKKAAKDVDKTKVKAACNKAIDSKAGDAVVKTVNKVAKGKVDKDDIKDGLNKILK